MTPFHPIAPRVGGPACGNPLGPAAPLPGESPCISNQPFCQT
jgi:hypothetical protein